MTSVSLAAATSGDESERIRLFERSLHPVVSIIGEPEIRWTLSDRMKHWKVPGLSIAVIRDGKLAWARGYGVLQAGKPEKVDTETVFSVGSVSKIGAAAITLRLVDAGELNLDRNVNDYLRRWKVPDNTYTAVRAVTLRGILSHSGGLSVHGFGDFLPGAPLPDIIDTLEGRAPARNRPVRVEYVPGSKSQYSGGGTTVEQLVIEEVTGMSFPRAAHRHLFEPLAMARSTYENPLPVAFGNIAKAHGEAGEPRALLRGYEAMPEMAASGLWTTPRDYAKLIIAIIESAGGTSPGFLSPSLARQMLSEVGHSVFGLGPALEGVGLERAFSHSGANDSYRAYVEGHPGTGNGVVIFTNGANGDELYPEVRRAIAQVEDWAPGLRDHIRVKPPVLSDRELAERVGLYEIRRATSSYRNRDVEGIRRVSARDGMLYINADGKDGGTRLLPVDAVHFVHEDDNGSLEFVRGYDGRISDLLIETESGTLELRKVRD